LPVGAWRLPPSHWVVGAPKPPPVAPGSTRNTRSHDSPLHPVPPRCSGPGARLAPGGPAERAGAKTRRELQWGRGEDCRGRGAPARLRLRMAILEQNALARRSPRETRVVTTAGLLVLARKFSQRLVAANVVLRVYKPRRCGAVGRKNCIGFIQV
jgi:hypothetical protein